MWSLEIVIFYCLICSAVGSVELSAHLRYCEKGQDALFYAEDFRKTVILGETFDNFCFTQDLVTMHCCLDKTLDINNSSSIVDFQIYNIISPGGSPIVWSMKKRDFGKVTADRQCVTFVVDSTAHNCKVNIIYRERGANSSAPNKTAVYFSNISHPRIPYSVQYRAPSVTMSVSESYTKAFVTPYSVSDNFLSTWLLCTCFVSSEQPQCELNPYGQSKRAFMWRTLTMEVPETTKEICFAIAKEYLGTFGPNRTCVPWTFLSEQALRQKSYFPWIVIPAAVVLLVLLVAGMIWYRRRRESSLNKNRNTSPTDSKGTDDIPEEEVDDHKYESITYSGHSVKSKYRPIYSDSAYESGKLDSPYQETYPAIGDGTVIDYPPLPNVKFQQNTESCVQPLYQSHLSQIISNVANVIPLYTESLLCKKGNLDANIDDKTSIKSSEETHSTSNESNGSEHLNTQDWYRMTQNTE